MFALVGHRGLGYFERVDRVRKHPALIAGPQNIAAVSLVQVPYRGGGPALTDFDRRTSASRVPSARDREAEADGLTRKVLTALRRTFITPLDRGGIKDLITSMDDAIDQMNQTASGAGSPSKPEEFLCGTEAGLRSLADFIDLQGHEQNPRAQRYMMGIDE